MGKINQPTAPEPVARRHVSQWHGTEARGGSTAATVSPRTSSRR
ncbi:MAG TPA: hypothetical protein QF604_12930 [Candidatus Latescibacteria bacterium]|nr:hypothetical protein [Candidatus Latescibacterota bacterium]MDP7634889.1 hypothetical protein [Candidatus Latescibacterota bacterium]HJN28813.1 hypothetical protein [Candidatus Latescibacterota bacterium]